MNPCSYYRQWDCFTKNLYKGSDLNNFPVWHQGGDMVHDLECSYCRSIQNTSTIDILMIYSVKINYFNIGPIFLVAVVMD